MTYLLLAVGLALLLGGGEYLVKGSVAVARRLGISPLVIGLTLVGFGTSTPELVASLNAALIGSPGIAVGNVVGSNIANILLILGAAAVILPIATTKNAFRRDGSVLIGASVLLLLLVLTGEVGRLTGLLFVALLVGYTLYTYFSERGRDRVAARPIADQNADTTPPMPFRKGILLALGGIAAVVLGANLLVNGAVEIARTLGMSEAVIGLTLVAVGTSLPELITSVLAAFRKQTDVAFGNIVGSNIFNMLGILGVTALVSPLPVPPEIVRFDIWVMIATTLLLAWFAVTNWCVHRWEGAVFLLAYLGYLAVQLSPGLRAGLGLNAA